MKSFYTCVKCGRCNFTSTFAVYGHQRLECVERLKREVFEEELQDGQFIVGMGSSEEGGNFEDMVDTIAHSCRGYIDIQRLTLSPALIDCLQTGYPRLLDSSRKVKGDLPTYFEIAEFLNSVVSLSSPDADGFLKLISRVTYMNGKEIPLPSRYISCCRLMLQSHKNKVFTCIALMLQAH